MVRNPGRQTWGRKDVENGNGSLLTCPSNKDCEGMGKEIRRVEHHTNLHQSQNRGGDLGEKKREIIWNALSPDEQWKSFQSSVKSRSISAALQPFTMLSPADRYSKWICYIPKHTGFCNYGSCAPHAKGTSIPTLFSINYTVLKIYRHVRLIFPSFFSRIMSYFCICVKVHLCLHRASENTQTSYFFAYESKLLMLSLFSQLHHWMVCLFFAMLGLISNILSLI